MNFIQKLTPYCKGFAIETITVSDSNREVWSGRNSRFLSVQLEALRLAKIVNICRAENFTLTPACRLLYCWYGLVPNNGSIWRNLLYINKSLSFNHIVSWTAFLSSWLVVNKSGGILKDYVLGVLAELNQQSISKLVGRTKCCWICRPK